MRRQENVSCITAIKHSLRDVDSRSCKVRLVVNVLDSIDRTTVNPHPHLNVRMILQSFADLERTAHRLFRTMKKKQRHHVAHRHSIETGRDRKSTRLNSSNITNSKAVS